MQSTAKTVREYLDSLPEERRKMMSTVRKVILKNLPKGYKEVMQYGMIGYVVPLSLYPAGYLGKKVPLPYAALASQKNYMSVYLMNVYGDKKNEAQMKRAFAKSGKKLDMGKSCIRFKKLEDLPLEVIGETIGRTSVKEFVGVYERVKRITGK